MEISFCQEEVECIVEKHLHETLGFPCEVVLYYDMESGKSEAVGRPVEKEKEPVCE